MSNFWCPIIQKSESQLALEEHVFGCDDLWSHIKTFIFSPKKCWTVDTTTCQGDVFISYIQKHTFVHFRQGAYKKGIYTTKKYTCRKHAASDPEHPCLIS